VFHDSITDAIFSYARHSTVPIIVLIVLCAIAGMPIFIVLSGLALFLFYSSNGFIETVPNEIYVMLTGNLIPAIPLFTLAGFILTEGRAGRRFVNLFKALFGAVPGGHAITAVIICALFTTLTGGSGVTILTLGALLLYILRKNGYGERFANGLIVSSGSTGLHFPPSLPLILYGVVTEMDIKQLFVGGLLPGALLLIALALFGAQHAVRNKIRTYPFSGTRAIVFFRGAFWEILFPVLIVSSYFSGFTSLVGTSALACEYAIVICVFIKRDIAIRDLPKVIAKSLPLIGGVLILYACALAFKIYIVDAEIPSQLALWMTGHVESKYLFLLILNGALLIAGFFTETVSAIIVLAPIVVPLGAAYGIHPVHLAIIFIANLELGFLTPPFGMNLFLASYRFNVPVSKIYRSVIPFFFVMLAGVLIITYVPWLSTGLLGLFKPGG
jgi:C4-dicarboxylate transporter DctM subunit